MQGGMKTRSTECSMSRRTREKRCRRLSFPMGSVGIIRSVRNMPKRLQEDRMVTENTEVVITLNDSTAAADLAAMLPLELTLIERNGFAKGMTLPDHLSASEATTREYEIRDFGYWDAGPDLAIFYDDIYEQTIVEVIPLGHAETGAGTMAGEVGTVRLELVNEKGDQAENE